MKSPLSREKLHRLDNIEYGIGLQTQPGTQWYYLFSQSQPNFSYKATNIITVWLQMCWWSDGKLATLDTGESPILSPHHPTPSTVTTNNINIAGIDDMCQYLLIYVRCEYPSCQVTGCICHAMTLSLESRGQLGHKTRIARAQLSDYQKTLQCT